MGGRRGDQAKARVGGRMCSSRAHWRTGGHVPRAHALAGGRRAHPRGIRARAQSCGRGSAAHAQAGSVRTQAKVGNSGHSLLLHPVVFFYVDTVCALALRAIRRSCSTEPTSAASGRSSNEDCFRELRPDADQAGVTSLSAHSSPDMIGREVALAKMTPKPRRRSRFPSSTSSSR